MEHEAIPGNPTQIFAKGNKTVTRHCFTVRYYVDGIRVYTYAWDRIGLAATDFKQIKRKIKNNEPVLK
jgi:hypothetical protein